MREQSCCFTGHRALPLEEIPKLKERLVEEIALLIQKGVTHFYAGGALGFDTLAAIATIKLKKQFPDISLHLILPHEKQTGGWSRYNKEIYQRLIAKADSVEYIAKNYYRGCLHTRNRQLIQHSQYCICYLAKSIGGTAFTVKYAQKEGLQIINLALTL